MTKAELIDAIAKRADVSKADAEQTVGAFFDIVNGENSKYAEWLTLV